MAQATPGLTQLASAYGFVVTAVSGATYCRIVAFALPKHRMVWSLGLVDTDCSQALAMRGRYERQGY